MSARRLVMVAIAISLLIVQEYAMMVIPNVQFTVLLILLFSSVFTFRESILMITGYVLLDMMMLGGLNPMYLLPMMMAWYLIPISYHTFLRRTNNETKLAVFALGFGFVYGWMYVPFRMLEQGIWNPAPYLMADLPFEIVMSVTGFITVLFLFAPLRVVLLNVTTSLELKKARS